MVSVKVFDATSTSELEKEINEFITVKHKIKDIKYSTTYVNCVGVVFSALIIYEYWGR